MKLTRTVAVRVAEKMRRDGFHGCTAQDVEQVYNTGDLPDRESLASRILQEFEELGVEVPTI